MADYNMTRAELEPLAGRSLIFLHQKAAEHGQARANANYLADFVKVVKAKEKASAPPGTSNAAAEDMALCSKAYQDALEAARTAEELWFTIQFKREAASANIEAWRTVCSNERASAG